MTAPETGWTRAMRRGDHATAWQIGTSDLASRDHRSRDDPAQPYHQRWVWDGSPVDGREVLVRCYHGLGDCLQFARFLPELARRAASVTVETPSGLLPLLTPLLAHVGGRAVPFDPAAPLGPGRCDIEIMELSLALQCPPQACPAAWLSVEPAILPPGTVGLCLTAGDWDPERSVPPALIVAPLQRPALALDLGPASPELAAAGVLNPGGGPEGMAVTAALVAGCTAVLTVDTMIAHLAGALGIPATVMLKHRPDWRWGTGAGRSAWYPAHRLLRQPRPGDWTSVIARARRTLAL